MCVPDGLLLLSIAKFCSTSELSEASKATQHVLYKICVPGTRRLPRAHEERPDTIDYGFIEVYTSSGDCLASTTFPGVEAIPTRMTEMGLSLASKGKKAYTGDDEHRSRSNQHIITEGKPRCKSTSDSVDNFVPQLYIDRAGSRVRETHGHYGVGACEAYRAIRW